MISRELIRKVKKIEIVTRHYVQDTMAGQYHSIFKGRGMSFQEVRQYQIGDDIRLIDWNVSARLGDVFVKLFVEEREVTVILLVDVSGSTLFGTRGASKREIIAEIAALLSFSAIENNDRVGLIMFSDRIEKFIPPKKGRKHVLRVVLSLLGSRTEGRRTDINVALDYLGKVLKRRSIVFLISDFLGDHYYDSIRLAAKKHDFVPVEIFDPRERPPQPQTDVTDAGRGLVPMGLVLVEDPETGETVWVNTSSRRVREGYARALKQEELVRGDFFRRNKIDAITIDVSKPYMDPLLKFFKLRARRARVRV
jgi:uncharacterized protein (DUF58 family)